MARTKNLSTTTMCVSSSLSPLTIYVIISLMILSVTARNSSKLQEVKVGVILDLETTLAKMSLSSLNIAISDFYESHDSYKTRLVLSVRDSKKDVVEAASAALGLIKNEKVEAIIGPQTSTQANFVISLGNKAQIPIITFSATSPSLASLRSSYFFQATQNDKSQVNAITSLVQAFGWSQVVPIYVDDEFGESIIPYLTDALQNASILVPYRAVISSTASEDRIESELYKLMTMQTRVFVVHMFPRLGSRVFAKAEEIGLMNEGSVWIVTNGVMNLFHVLNSSTVDSMHGVLGIKSYVPKSRELDGFRTRWKTQFRRENLAVANVDDELDAFSCWGYDAVFALAMAIEKVFGDNGQTNNSVTGLDSGQNSSRSTDLDTIGVSPNGLMLQNELGKIRFKGLAGEFSLVNGQLQSQAFEIVNVNSNGERVVGFWTPQSGLARRPSSGVSKSTGYSTSRSNLGPIIWPGDSTKVPKGWTTPTNGKTLRVGVPLKLGNSSFIKLTIDASTNTTQATGFCIEVFNAAMEAMPYAVRYEFVPFVKPNGERGGSYDELIYQVYLGNFDAVAADVTIVSNRSKYVDFTLPYTDSGVTMMVPIRGTKMKNAWVFLKPWTVDLWATTCCFFVFIGFVIWVLEHRINHDFRGPPSYQIGTSFWFSFSTMVFAHREKVVSNLARFVVIVWCFVVLILTQSYTASLTSMLTVQQLRPTFTDVKQLLQNKAVIGFPKGSFVYGMLKEFIPFENYKEYRSLQHLGELFANGEIEAAYDEIPYLKVFIATHCSSYAMVGQIYKTDGFGFAFPRGSPLAGDLSRAILNVTEGDEIRRIENAWFVSDTVCPDSSAVVTSASLGLNSFWGLFLIAGVASFSALTVFVVTFLYQNRQILMSFTKENSVRHRIGVIFGIFNDKDLSSHTFRKNSEVEQQHVNNNNHVGMDTMTSSPNTNSPPRPSTYSCCSNHSEFIFPSHEESVTPSSDHNGQRSLETTDVERTDC